MLTRRCLLLAIVLGGCPARTTVECVDETSCRLAVGGACVVNPASGNQFCVYPDPGCPTGQRWSDLDVEPDVSGVCVALPDAGVDAPPACVERVAYVTGPAGAREVWTALPDGTSAVNVSNDGSDDTFNAWSPGGQEILIRSSRSGNRDLWVVRRDGGAPVNLTRSPDDEFDGAWSPDGSKIAFGRPSGLWVMASDGTLVTRLTMLAPNGAPRWSPSGTMLLFGHQADPPYSDLYTVTLAGELRRLTATVGVSEPAAGWSPDGGRIAFQRITWPGGVADSDVWTMNGDGTGATNLTPNTPASSDSGSHWTPDGSEVVVGSNREGGYKVFRIPVGGGPATRVSNNDLSGGINGDSPTDVASGAGRVLFIRYLPQNKYAVGTIDLSGDNERTFSDATQTAFAGAWSPCR